MKALFVNENLGGHATVHANLRQVLADRKDVHAEFVDVPKPNLMRRVLGVRLPGLSQLDLDFQPLRFQLAASGTVCPEVQRALQRQGHDVLHVYTHTAAWLFPDILRRMPYIVATDATHSQTMAFRAYRRPAAGTSLTGKPIERLERQVLRAATAVVAQSEWTAQALRKLGVPDDRLRITRYAYLLNRSR